MDRKAKAIEMLGGMCASCGYAENMHALTIDHVKPLLRSERGEKTGGDVYRLIANGFTPLEGLQILCANCHMIKTYNEDRKTFKQYIP